MTRGGKRENAGGGKPKLPANEKRVNVTIKLHPKIIKAVKSQKISQGKYIEKLVCDDQGIEL